MQMAIFSLAILVEILLKRYCNNIIYLANEKFYKCYTRLYSHCIQMDDTINYLAANNVRLLKKGEVRDSNSTEVGATVGMLWLDIEGTQVLYSYVYYNNLEQ